MSAEVDDLLETPEQSRRKLSLRIQAAHDVTLPRLEGWNYGPCVHHEVPKVDCEYRACGGELFRIQRIGVSWMYVIGRGLLADFTGLGKTNQILALLTLMKMKGELTSRAVVVCQNGAIGQWHKELKRWAPGLDAIAATGTPSTRYSHYSSNWDVCIIGAEMLLRDERVFEHFAPLALLVADDVDPLRKTTNATNRTFSRLAAQSDRCIVINATPLQIRLQELYATAVPVGARDIFGSEYAFERRYVRMEKVRTYGKGGRIVWKDQTIGYRNMEEFVAKIRPIALRRTDEDADDVRMPKVLPPEDVWLDLTKAQRKKYEELRKGVLRIITEEGTEVKRAVAFAKITYGAEICASLTALGEPDGPEASVKLNWLEDKLTGDWIEKKIIVFSRFKGTIRALKSRLAARGIEVASIWGDEPSASVRTAAIDRFWNHPSCRVIVGTTAIARSHNLQISNVVVNFDTLLNPATMTQIVGRSKRAGSPHKHIYVFNLFCRDTQEDRYLEVLERRQALANYVWGEDSELYDSLSPFEMLQLIRP